MILSEDLVSPVAEQNSRVRQARPGKQGTLLNEPFAKFVAGQVNVLANVMFHS